MRRFSPFEIEASQSTLEALDGHLSGIAFDSMVGVNWLRDRNGNSYAIHVKERDLEFKFEVFSLSIRTVAELVDDIAVWEPPKVPTEMPDAIRSLIMRRPEVPSPPREFQPWPFGDWRFEVLRRAEFIVEDVEVVGAVGETPNMQSAAVPGRVPANASAECEVAVGLLFSGLNGDQLLIAADWMPFATIVTRDPAAIAAFLEPCQIVEVSSYVESYLRT